MVFGGFPKNIRNKTFYFYNIKKINFFLFLLSFGPRVHFRGQKLTFWQKKKSTQKTEDPQILSKFQSESCWFLPGFLYTMRHHFRRPQKEIPPKNRRPPPSQKKKLPPFLLA
jgi:hypothetical protein